MKKQLQNASPTFQSDLQNGPISVTFEKGFKKSGLHFWEEPVDEKEKR